MLKAVASSSFHDAIAMMYELWIGAVLDQQAHNSRFGETCRQPKRCCAHQLRGEIEILRGPSSGRPGSERSVSIGPVIEQSARHRLVATHDRNLQRSEAGRRGVGVRALFKEEFKQLS